MKDRNYQLFQKSIERCCKAFEITMAEFYAENLNPDFITNEELELIKRIRRLSAYWKDVVKNIAYVTD